jgi:acetyl-CoA acetyltransferase
MFDCFDRRVSAANASQLSDGAAAVLLMSAKKVANSDEGYFLFVSFFLISFLFLFQKARSLGLKPKARIVATAVVGSDPKMMLG